MRLRALLFLSSLIDKFAVYCDTDNSVHHALLHGAKYFLIPTIARMQFAQLKREA